MLTLVASSVGTASLASFLLGKMMIYLMLLFFLKNLINLKILAGIMMFLIIISKRLNINPDNVATVCIKIQFIIHKKT